MTTFNTTRWTIVRQAGADDPGGRDALASLYLGYWKPVYEFTRRHSRCSEDDARDLVQEFFAETLRKNWLVSADRSRGRFRSFLLVVLKRFLADAREKQNRMSRGGGIEHLSIDWENASEIQETSETPEFAYDRHWALTVLETAAGKLREESVAAGKAGIFDGLAPHLNSEAADSYEVTGGKLGMSPGAVAMAVHRLRARLRDLIRREIAKTLDDEGQVEAELAELIAALRT